MFANGGTSQGKRNKKYIVKENYLCVHVAIRKDYNIW